MEFQRTSLEMSRQFLETQQNVMLAYLNAGAHQPNDLVVQNFRQPSAQPRAAVTVENPAPFPNTNYDESLHHRPVDLARDGGGSSLGSEALILESAFETRSDAAHSLPNGSVGVVQNIVAQSIATMPQVIQDKELGITRISSEDLIVSLIEIVSERTGYPPEMLDPTLDLEADLGIDSIKRVEILNSFRKRLPESSQKSLEGGIEQLAGVKSLQGIIDWIKAELTTGTTTPIQESST